MEREPLDVQHIDTINDQEMVQEVLIRNKIRVLSVFNSELVAMDLLPFYVNPYRSSGSIQNDFSQRYMDISTFDDYLALEHCERLERTGFLTKEIVVNNDSGKQVSTGYLLTSDGFHVGLPIATLAIQAEEKMKQSIYAIVGRTRLEDSENKASYIKSESIFLLSHLNSPKTIADFLDIFPTHSTRFLQRDVLEPLLHENIITLITPDGEFSQNLALLKTGYKIAVYSKGEASANEIITKIRKLRNTVRKDPDTNDEILSLREHAIYAIEAIIKDAGIISQDTIIEKIPKKVIERFKNSESLNSNLNYALSYLAKNNYLQPSKRQLVKPLPIIILTEKGEIFADYFVNPIYKILEGKKDEISINGEPVNLDHLVEETYYNLDLHAQTIMPLYYPESLAYAIHAKQLQEEQIVEKIANKKKEGISVEMLIQETNISRQTIYRRLSFLVATGYIAYNKDKRLFRIKDRVPINEFLQKELPGIDHKIAYSLYQHPLGLTTRQLQSITNLTKLQIESLNFNHGKIRKVIFDSGLEKWVYFNAYWAEKILSRFCKNADNALLSFPKGKITFLNKKLLNIQYTLDESTEDSTILQQLRKKQVLQFQKKNTEGVLLNIWYIGNLDRQPDGTVGAKKTNYFQNFRNILILALNNELLPKPLEREAHTRYSHETYITEGKVDLNKVFVGLQQNDTVAQEIMYANLNKMFHEFLRNSQFSEQEIEDQTQETLIRLFNALSTNAFPTFNHFKQFGYTIARNIQTDRIRRRNLINFTSLDEAVETNNSGEPAVEIILPNISIYLRMKHHLTSILTAEQLIIMDLYTQEHTFEKISKKLHTSKEHVEMEYSRALDRIKSDKGLMQKLHDELF